MTKRKYAGAAVSDLTRIRSLGTEIAQLKRICAGLALQNSAIKDVLPQGFYRRP